MIAVTSLFTSKLMQLVNNVYVIHSMIQGSFTNKYIILFKYNRVVQKPQKIKRSQLALSIQYS